MKPEIKFISYTGEYPNLCRGVLTLEIDGKEYKFGRDYSRWFGGEEDTNYEAFWVSGGSAGVDMETYEDFCFTGEWEFKECDKFPEELKGYEEDLIRVFNENVPYGCCGGCI